MKSMIPEITVYRLEEATAILEEDGIKYRIKEISPPYLSRKIKEKVAGKDQGKMTGYRVLRQTVMEGNILELIVAKEITCV